MRSACSGYRIMWMMVMFDLPVTTPKQRKVATKFRNFLLDLGFDMAQFSVYYRVMGSKEVAARYLRSIELNIPEDGSINILTITDKQYENMVCFTGTKKSEPPRVLQLSLF